jgi:hypothetical protein
VNAGNRFGFIVAGYSGRDLSVMELLDKVLKTNNPFPHGLFWTGLKGSPIRPAVEELLARARARSVIAKYVPIETFDALLLKLWRNLEDKPVKLDGQVRKLAATSVAIPLPPAGQGKPILRLNALPLLSTPAQCLELSFKTPKDWEYIRRAQIASRGNLILTRGENILCWGARDQVKAAFGDDLLSAVDHDMPDDICSPGNLYIKGFVEEALCRAMSRNKPLRARINKSSALLISNATPDTQTALAPLTKILGATAGEVAGLIAPATPEHPRAEEVTWAEALRISIDFKNGQLWLLLDPDIWIWPPRARKDATDFLDKRRGGRFNKEYNNLLNAWIQVILGSGELNADTTLSVFEGGSPAENPSFKLTNRTAFAWRLVR